jgi:hypothetical protein
MIIEPPKYASEAVRDLERTAVRLAPQAAMARYCDSLRLTAGLIRDSVHVILPFNGEVYRSNERGGEMPTSDECDSFVGLPAPVTCFQYDWEYMGLSNSSIHTPRRITLVLDGKQAHEGEVPDGFVEVATFVSVIFHEKIKQWALLDSVLKVKQPLTVDRGGYKDGWGVHSSLLNIVTGQEIQDSEAGRLLLSGFLDDINVVVQCLHSLRAGASLEEQPRLSELKRMMDRKKGLPEFTYHVLKLPAHVSRSGGVPVGSHASPRFHVRRAHIRKLSSGTLTFVRQCFVGDKTLGTVQKHYEVQ